MRTAPSPTPAAVSAPTDSDAPEVAGDGRRVNGERTRARLLQAAKTEFAAHGYAGARVAAIAARAGVNKQLIAYHFGGKQGLYRQLVADWLARETEMRADAPPLPTLVRRYLDNALDDPEGVRMAMWEALDGAAVPVPGSSDADLADLCGRQRRNELGPELDPGATLLAVTGMVTAPVVLAGPGSAVAQDRERYAATLTAIVRRLAGPPPG